MTEQELQELEMVATRRAAGLRIIEGAEWRVFYDDYEAGTLFVGHKSKSGGIDYLAGGIREAEVAEFIATFNPRTVLALIQAARERDELEQWLERERSLRQLVAEALLPLVDSFPEEARGPVFALAHIDPRPATVEEKQYALELRKVIPAEEPLQHTPTSEETT